MHCAVAVLIGNFPLINQFGHRTRDLLVFTSASHAAAIAVSGFTAHYKRGVSGCRKKGI